MLSGRADRLAEHSEDLRIRIDPEPNISQSVLPSSVNRYFIIPASLKLA